MKAASRYYHHKKYLAISDKVFGTSVGFFLKCCLLILIFYSKGIDKEEQGMKMRTAVETDTLCHLSLPKLISNMVS